MASEYEQTARVFKALGDENRLRILQLLRGGEKCACKLLDDLRITQSTLSHHMKLLCDAGIVRGRKDGKWVHYSIDPEGGKRAAKLLGQQLTAEDQDEPETNCKCRLCIYSPRATAVRTLFPWKSCGYPHEKEAI